MSENPEANTEPTRRPGRTLLAWMGAITLLHAVAWASGGRGEALAEAVERGAARVEANVVGEVPESQVREAIASQRDTLRFWAALAAVEQLAIEPLVPAVRAVLAALAFAATAALTGRAVAFGATLAGAARAQGFWVLGLAVQVALMIGLEGSGAETSAVLLLPPGAYPAPLWAALGQVDPFVLLGWAAVAAAGYRLGQVNLFGSATICLMLWASESLVRVAGETLAGAAIRASLLPR